MGYAFMKSANLDVGAAWSWEEYTQLGVKFGRDAGLRNGVKEHLVKSKQPEHLAPLWNPKKLAEDMYEVFQKLLSVDGWRLTVDGWLLSVIGYLLLAWGY